MSITSIESLMASMRNLQQQLASLRLDVEQKASAKDVEQLRIETITAKGALHKKANSKDISLLDQRLAIMDKKLLTKVESADFVKLTSDLRNETTNRMNEASDMKKAKAHQDSVIKQLVSH